jgi:O-antigen/teichoic acid export membrane protein
VGSVAGFAGVLCGIWWHVSLPILVMAIAGAPVLATTLNTIHFFAFVRPDLRPVRTLVSRETVAQISQIGGLFFVLQVVVAIAYSADNFIVARLLGAVNVPEYSIPQRMFALIATVSSMFVAPLWPAYGEAISRGDIRWVRHTLRNSLLFVMAGSFMASFAMLLLSPLLLHWWVGGRIHPPFMLLLGLAVWTVLSCCGDAFAMFLNGSEIIRFQVMVAALFGIGCIIAKIFFVQHYGITGIPWATITTYILLTAFPLAIYLPRILKKLDRAERKIQTQGINSEQSARTSDVLH